MSVERILLVPDTHAPYEDRKAWRVMMNAAKEFKPHTIVHLGDLADCYAISSHSKDPTRVQSLKKEIGRVRELRGELDSLKPRRKIFIEGNHEDRLRRYLQDKAPELFELITTDHLLQLSDNNWELVPYRKSIRIGKLFLTHDVGSSGKYSTARALETFQHSVAIGHHHALQYHVAGDATGQYQVGAQVGWLGDIEKVDYLHRIKVQRLWSLGFGTARHDTRTGVVYVTPHPIVNYTACVEGRIYRA